MNLNYSCLVVACSPQHLVEVPWDDHGLTSISSPITRTSPQRRLSFAALVICTAHMNPTWISIAIVSPPYRSLHHCYRHSVVVSHPWAWTCHLENRATVPCEKRGWTALKCTGMREWGEDWCVVRSTSCEPTRLAVRVGHSRKNVWQVGMLVAVVSWRDSDSLPLRHDRENYGLTVVLADPRRPIEVRHVGHPYRRRRFVLGPCDCLGGLASQSGY